jgi:hypothetical protein
MDPIFMKYRI